MPTALTNVNLQGKSSCTYTVGFFFSPKPQRAKFASQYPSSAEENQERLEDAGQPMEQLQPVCRRCNGTHHSRYYPVVANNQPELGHVAKNCSREFTAPVDQPSITCTNCNEAGHRRRDCPKPREDPNACRNCKQSGHRATDCTEPRSAEGVECKRCNESECRSTPDVNVNTDSSPQPAILPKTVPTAAATHAATAVRRVTFQRSAPSRATQPQSPAATATRVSRRTPLRPSSPVKQR